MDDTGDTIPQGDAPWLLFIHQLPLKPDYLRVKVRRRLQRIGAVALKNTVYVLPKTGEMLEDLHWLRAEITAGGGTAIITEASFLAGISDEEVRAIMRAERAAPGTSAPPSSAERVEPGRAWVTRENVFVDRIASAWLIRRFIDPAAEFKFVPARGYRPGAGELRFDMYDAEYTHEGERCTFQTLLRRFGLRDTALDVIGEIVHDIDCKDERFGRAETAGVSSLIRGIVKANDSDQVRLERGAAVFEDLYHAFGGAAR